MPAASLRADHDRAVARHLVEQRGGGTVLAGAHLVVEHDGARRRVSDLDAEGVSGAVNRSQEETVRTADEVVPIGR